MPIGESSLSTPTGVVVDPNRLIDEMERIADYFSNHGMLENWVACRAVLARLQLPIGLTTSVGTPSLQYAFAIVEAAGYQVLEPNRQWPDTAFH